MEDIEIAEKSITRIYQKIVKAQADILLYTQKNMKIMKIFSEKHLHFSEKYVMI